MPKRRNRPLGSAPAHSGGGPPKAEGTQSDRAASSPGRTDDGMFGLSTRTLLELLIGAVVIPLLGYSAYKVTALDTTVQVTNQRLDRFVQAFPEVHQKVVEERAKLPVRFAVLATRPNPGEKTALLHVVNLENHTAQTIPVPAQTATTTEFAQQVRGLAVSLDSSAMDFATYSKYLEETGKPAAEVPEFVDTKNSFALSALPTTLTINTQIEAFENNVGTEAVTSTVNLSVSTFPDLTKSINVAHPVWTTPPATTTQSPP